MTLFSGTRGFKKFTLPVKNYKNMAYFLYAI
ncbi:hypothetical protein CDSM653_01591 [Caldanaerobacter subterraneus subsp. pacificus DSM 12653]|uniref:Uncharacterized protein n=1 Tax=Caldanaerobacter subterraneus subsp. pacificus DSM 12653 TaxID=391606 RepID=A0A0F5PL68_9THEO|nr:hypothetical protein CDSM653_01591 [Caldanaerobacter subterraneus subsp. pacificus DSM 12653]